MVKSGVIGIRGLFHCKHILGEISEDELILQWLKRASSGDEGYSTGQHIFG
jgi:hypothetical protein